jgi:hypothetical protein
LPSRELGGASMYPWQSSPRAGWVAAQHRLASEHGLSGGSSPQPSNPDTGNKLLVLRNEDSVGDERRSQSPKAGSYPGLPEGSCPGPGRHDRPARGHIDTAYPAEASANDAGSRSARWRVARMVTSVYLRVIATHVRRLNDLCHFIDRRSSFMSESAAVRQLAGGPDRGHVRRAVTGRSLNVALATRTERACLVQRASRAGRRARLMRRLRLIPVQYLCLLSAGNGARRRRSGWLRPPGGAAR